MRKQTPSDFFATSPREMLSEWMNMLVTERTLIIRHMEEKNIERGGEVMASAFNDVFTPRGYQSPFPSREVSIEIARALGPAAATDSAVLRSLIARAVEMEQGKVLRMRLPARHQELLLDVLRMGFHVDHLQIYIVRGPVEATKRDRFAGVVSRGTVRIPGCRLIGYRGKEEMAKRGNGNASSKRS